MNNIKRIAKNIVSLSFSELLCRVIGVFLFIILARYLGPEKYGVYSIALSFISIFVLLSNFGLDTVYIKDVSRDKTLSSEYFSSCAILKLSISFLSFIVLIILVTVLKYDGITKSAIILYGISIIFQSNVQLISSVFRAYEVMEYSAFINITRSTISFILILLLIFLRQDILPIVCAQSFSFLIVCVIFYLLLIKKSMIKIFSFNHRLIKKLFFMALPFIGIGIVYVINLRIDVIFISKYINETAVGFYSAANELVLTLYTIPVIVSGVLFPVLSRHYNQKEDSLSLICNFSTKVLISLGIPIGVGLFILAPNAIKLAFGNEYIKSIPVLQILSISLILTFGRLIFSWLLTSIEKVKYALYEYILCLLINVTLNVILIPLYGIKGAATATVSSAVIGNCYLYYQVNKRLSNVIFLKHYLKPIVASTFMAVFIVYMKNLNLAMLISIGSIIYFIMAYFLKIFSREEYVLLKEATTKADST